MNETQLLEDNTKLVTAVAKTFAVNYDTFQDLIQVGQIGLLQAIRIWDKNKGALSTIAWHYIRGAMLKHLRQETKQETIKQKIKEEYTNCPYHTPTDIRDYIPQGLLSDIEIQIIELKYIGYNFKEIGQICGKSRTWVSTKYKNAVKHIIDANA